MKRRAILIEASNVPGETPLPGAQIDIQNCTTWLKSNGGGAWDSDEINILSHPSPLELKCKLLAASNADYAFIMFSGHGDHVSDQFQDDTKLLIQQGKEYSTRELAKMFTKCTVVVDACRSVRQELLTESRRSVLAKALMTSDNNSRLRHRALFDAAVSASENGAVFLFSCSKDESAAEFSNGGAFSFGLFQNAREWWDASTSGHLLSVYDAFQGAKMYVENKVSQQTPEMDGSMRRRRHFPFAVRA